MPPPIARTGTAHTRAPRGSSKGGSTIAHRGSPRRGPKADVLSSIGAPAWRHCVPTRPNLRMLHCNKWQGH
eukprot:10298727-Alexandrium_andersonii.AAC.1